MTAWSHLPNAALIDEVMASVKANPKKWGAAWGACRDVAPRSVWDVARSAAWDAAWDTGRDADWDAVWNAVWSAARHTARDTAAALATYDDAGQFMKLPAEHLQRLYRIDPHPMFLLLQPAAIVFGE